MTLETLWPARPVDGPTFISTHVNKPRNEHESPSISRRKAARHPIHAGTGVAKIGHRCIKRIRIKWDAEARCALPDHHAGVCGVTRASLRVDAIDPRRSRPLRLPARRRSPNPEPPDREFRDRQLRDATKLGMADAVRATLEGLDGPSPLFIRGHLRVLERAVGKWESCRSAQAIQEINCGIYAVINYSCHQRPCPDCDLLRTAAFARVGEALVRDAGGEDHCSFMVTTAINPAFGTLERERKRHSRHNTRLRAAPPFSGGACPYHGHGPAFNKRHTAPDGRVFIGHKAVPGGFTSVECPVSKKTPETWNLHTNHVLEGAPFIDKSELRWWWRRITCPKHPRNCPGTCPHYGPGEYGTETGGCDGICEGLADKRHPEGKRPCRGGAWDVYIEKMYPGRVREAVKYPTKSGEILSAGAPAVVEFVIAMRASKLINRWGTFRDREFVVDPNEQADADRELQEVNIGNGQTRKMLLNCPNCKQLAIYDATTLRVVLRRDCRLVGGHDHWRPPPKEGDSS